MPLPGIEPVVFAPGIVSSDNQEHSAPAISPGGKEIYWSLWPLPYAPEKPQVIKFVRYKNGTWSDPEIAPFSGKYSDGSPCFSPDGKRLYFCSRRPLEKGNEPKSDADIWFVERSGEGWKEPEHPGFTINSDRFVYSLSIAQNGNLYFCAGYQVNGISDGSVDIFISRMENGEYATPERMSEIINTPQDREAYPFIAPDESFLIFVSDTRQFSSDGKFLGGDSNMLISFRNEDGSWEEPVDMGKMFNEKKARFPGISPDGKYLFFTRFADESNEDIFWVDASVIKELKRGDNWK